MNGDDVMERVEDLNEMRARLVLDLGYDLDHLTDDIVRRKMQSYSAIADLDEFDRRGLRLAELCTAEMSDTDASEVLGAMTSHLSALTPQAMTTPTSSMLNFIDAHANALNDGYTALAKLAPETLRRPTADYARARKKLSREVVLSAKSAVKLDRVNAQLIARGVDHHFARRSVWVDPSFNAEHRLPRQGSPTPAVTHLVGLTHAVWLELRIATMPNPTPAEGSQEIYERLENAVSSALTCTNPKEVMA